MNRRKFLRGAAACASLPVVASGHAALPADVIKYGEYQVVTEPQSVAASALSELTTTASYMQGRTPPKNRTGEAQLTDMAGNPMPWHPWG